MKGREPKQDRGNLNEIVPKLQPILAIHEQKSQIKLNYTDLNAEIVPKNETLNRNNPNLKIEIEIRTVNAKDSNEN